MRRVEQGHTIYGAAVQRCRSGCGSRMFRWIDLITTLAAVSKHKPAFTSPAAKQNPESRLVCHWNVWKLIVMSYIWINIYACMNILCMNHAYMCRKVVICGNLPAAVSSLQSTLRVSTVTRADVNRKIVTLFQNFSCMYVCMNVC